MLVECIVEMFLYVLYIIPILDILAWGIRANLYNKENISHPYIIN